MIELKDIDVLYETSQPIRIENVNVTFSQNFNEKKIEKFEAKIDESWAKIVKENPRFYNALKFRLQNVVFDSNILSINLGLTDYKHTLCTNHSEHVHELKEKGLECHKDKDAYFSHSLGVGSIVLSADNYIVLIKRADWVAEAKGRIDTPGGHAEPEEVLSNDLCKNISVDKIFSVKPEVIRYELFHSMVREIRDELNVPEDSLSFPELLGVVRNQTLGGKPGLVFHMSSKLSREEIENMYEEGGLETDESTQLVFVHINDVLKPSPDTLNLVSKMAPCGQAAMLFFYNYKKRLQENCY